MLIYYQTTLLVIYDIHHHHQYNRFIFSYHVSNCGNILTSVVWFQNFVQSLFSLSMPWAACLQSMNPQESLSKWVPKVKKKGNMGSESKKKGNIKIPIFLDFFFTCLDLRENPNQGLKFYFCQIVTLLELGVPTFLLSVEARPLPKQRRKRTRRMVAVWFAVIIIVVLLGERLLTVDVAELLLVEVLTHDGSSFTFKVQK